MSDAHDHAIVGPCRFCECVRWGTVTKKRVVAYGQERTRQVQEEAVALMVYATYPPVHRFRCVINFAAARIPDPLVPQAHSEDRDLLFYQKPVRYAEVFWPLWPTGAGRDDGRIEMTIGDERPGGIVLDNLRNDLENFSRKLVQIEGE